MEPRARTMINQAYQGMLFSLIDMNVHHTPGLPFCQATFRREVLWLRLPAALGSCGRRKR